MTSPAQPRNYRVNAYPYAEPTDRKHDEEGRGIFDGQVAARKLFRSRLR